MEEHSVPSPFVDPALLASICVLIPAYQEEAHIHDVILAARDVIPQVVVIDDGSSDRTSEEAEKAGARVLRHAANQGKGAALLTGLTWADAQGFEAVITMDADGQHDPDELPVFLRAYQRTGIPALIGNRMLQEKSMPWLRRQTNRFMSWLISRSMGQYVPDTQCGYRLYHRSVWPWLKVDTQRFAAESEMLLQLAIAGIRIDSVPVSVIYGTERSKIRPVLDTFRFFQMMSRHQKRVRLG